MLAHSVEFLEISHITIANQTSKKMELGQYQEGFFMTSIVPEVNGSRL